MFSPGKQQSFTLVLDVFFRHLNKELILAFSFGEWFQCPVLKECMKHKPLQIILCEKIVSCQPSEHHKVTRKANPKYVWLKFGVSVTVTKSIPFNFNFHNNNAVAAFKHFTLENVSSITAHKTGGATRHNLKFHFNMTKHWTSVTLIEVVSIRISWLCRMVKCTLSRVCLHLRNFKINLLHTYEDKRKHKKYIKEPKESPWTV